MRNLFFLLLFVFAMEASAADASRCGTDAFGNDVCLDKNGVLTTAPAKSGDNQSGVNAEGEKAGSTNESGNAPRENSQNRKRCGTDQFGNHVCL
ncbi:MAG: hypothetical protein KKH12_08060 [Gammaproteobacteria bacterium]|nr:hypothetical protein [Gammaproteobacteria bacterium]MBU1481616.1 hypothetical protein [Gammaproteobacteria bacterium]